MEKEFTELLHQNQGIVHKICNLYFYSRLEKQDYMQELVIQLWKAYPSFNNQSKFSTWMYRVCLNAAIDIIRKEKSQLKFERIDDVKANKMQDIINEVDDKQEKLFFAINSLTEIDKAIITLYLDEFSYQEIADIVGISESYTGVKINRIKSEILKSFNNGNK
jgi:RNA polymerase sigma-70 factor, ECF subfamily